MKPFQRVMQKLQSWKQEHLLNAPLFEQKILGRTLTQWTEPILQHSHSTLTHLKLDQVIPFLLRPSVAQRRFLRRRRSQPPIVLAIAVLSLTSAMGYRFYDEPQLAIGTIAPQSLKAPATVRIVDQRTTEANRKAARTAGVPVLMVDKLANQKIYQTVQTLLREGDDLRRQVGSLPYIDPFMLSTTAQRYLRQAPEWEWRATIAKVEGKIEEIPSLPPAATAPDASSSSQELAILELQNYRRNASDDDFSILKQVIERARQRYVTVLSALDDSNTEGFYDTTLLTLKDSEWDQTKAIVRQTLERMLAQGIPHGIPPALLESAIKAQLDDSVTANIQPQARKILTAVIRPNLTPDLINTKRQAEQAALSVPDVMVSARRGDTIVRQGEQISPEEFALLDHFGMSRRQWGGGNFSIS
jgi:cyclic-di-AMP phosphodiesterase PgpH